MKNRIVIVSAFVDNLIKERQPDTEFHIFPGIRELLNYSEKSFIRADKMYITHINESFEGDVYFPQIDEKEWKIV